MSSNPRKQLENWLKTIDVKGRVIDVGGVSININPKRVKSWEAKDYKVLDRVKSDYIYDINYPFHLEEKFDTAFCLEVMEYVWNPVQALKNIHDLLEENGLLYISFHFMFPHHHPRETDCLRYTINGIKKLMKETGFEIEQEVPKTAKYPDELEKWCYTESKLVFNKGQIGYLIKGRRINK